MDRSAVRVCRLEEQDEAFCLSLSPAERIGVLEELNRQGRIMAGYGAVVALDRSVVSAA